MLNPAPRPSFLPFSVERRRHQRVHVNLFGRYIRADNNECPCYVSDMSPGGMALMTEISGRPGERIVAYVDHVGRLEGRIVRSFPNGFALKIAVTQHKREKLAAQLTWLANRSVLPDQRRHLRITPQHPDARLTLPDGSSVGCRVIDISQSGAGIASDERPELGALITVGKTRARVIRSIPGGFAVEFLRLLHQDCLEENVTGS